MLERIPGLVLLILSIILVAQSAITLTSWDKNKPKNTSNYYFTLFTTFMAVIGILASFWLIAKPPAGLGGQFIPKLKESNFTNGAAVRAKEVNLETQAGKLKTTIDTQLANAQGVLRTAAQRIGATAAAVAEAQAKGVAGASG
jgi:hypothetical protein